MDVLIFEGEVSRKPLLPPLSTTGLFLAFTSWMCVPVLGGVLLALARAIRIASCLTLSAVLVYNVAL